MLKIFEITHENGEKEWCTGETNIDALAYYLTATECDLWEMRGAKIVEIPKEKWEEYKLKDSDEEIEYSFQEWMDKYGSGSPEIICGTMYYL